MQRFRLWLPHVAPLSQCLIHVPELAVLALRDEHEAAINPNARFGSGGELTRALA